MQLAAQEISMRRPVWEAMSDLFLDTELDEADLRRLAHVLAESPYDEQELDRILYGEVYPVCISNLRCVAGEWEGIDGDWLVQRILANESKFWKRWRLFQTPLPDWRKVMVFVREERRAKGRD